MEAKEQIRERIDVADLIGEYLTLKPAGQGAFKALCPFHGENTPSFHISRPKQIWHCFGCDKGGDIFSFVMEMEGMEFPEALRLLAGKAGVELPKFEGRRDEGKKSLARDLNDFAQKVYAKYLESSSGKVAADYLKNRGIDEALIMKFGLGYAPAGWSSLCDLAKKKQIKDQDLIDAGLAIPRRTKSGVIDRFRHRLMIPFRDRHGNTIGFTGRVLDPEDNPKYMNSPQTEIYDKSGFLYGLDLAKTAIKREKAVIIVEGNLDVVASHKAHVEHVVASSGTALTERQIGLLKRYTKTLIFCFDTDDAGFNAARRGMRLASELGCDVRVAMIPPDAGKDPDDVVQKNPDTWRKIVAQHVDKMDFLFDRLVATVDVRDVQQKKQAGASFLPEIAALPDPIEEAHWIHRFAAHVQVSEEVVRQTIDSFRKSKGELRSEKREVARNQEKGHEKKQETPVEIDPMFELLYSIGIESRASMAIFIGSLDPGAVDQPVAKKLYDLARNVYHSPQLSSSNKSFFEALREHLQAESADLVSLFDRIALKADDYREEISKQSGETTFLHTLIENYHEQSKRRRRDAILQSLKRAEDQNDTEQIESLMHQYQSLL